MFVVDAARKFGSGARNESGQGSHRDRLARLMSELVVEARMDDALTSIEVVWCGVVR